jgi:hypothetical protein
MCDQDRETSRDAYILNQRLPFRVESRHYSGFPLRNASCPFGAPHRRENGAFIAMYAIRLFIGCSTYVVLGCGHM